VNKRILVPLAVLVLAALTINACGGGGSGDEDKIVETIETASTTSDPSNCTKLETLSFDEQNSAVKGKDATKACEAQTEEGKEQAKGVEVSNILIEGKKATAEVTFEGGSLGSQAVTVALAEESGDWKLDQVEGFADYDGKALGAAFEKRFEESPEGLNSEQASCIAEGVADASKAQAEEFFFTGSPTALEKLARSCR
jgi:hypothetical protein